MFSGTKMYLTPFGKFEGHGFKGFGFDFYNKSNSDINLAHLVNAHALAIIIDRDCLRFLISCKHDHLLALVIGCELYTVLDELSQRAFYRHGLQ
jgi:hypothetical protein